MDTGHDPATKQDISNLRTDLRAEMSAMEGRLVEVIRDNQTEVRKAFYSFAESNQQRLTATERDSAALKDRMALFEKRLTDLERKVSFPDHPTQ